MAELDLGKLVLATSEPLVVFRPLKACHTSMVFIEVFGRFLDGFEKKSSQKWLIFGRFHRPSRGDEKSTKNDHFLVGRFYSILGVNGWPRHDRPPKSRVVFGQNDRFWAFWSSGRLVAKSQPIGYDGRPPKTTDECHMPGPRAPESTQGRPTFGGCLAGTQNLLWHLG